MSVTDPASVATDNAPSRNVTATDAATSGQDDSRNGFVQMVAAIEAGTPAETKERRRRAHDLAETGDSCFECARAFEPGEIACMTRISLGVGFFGTYMYRILPVCEGCLSPWTRQRFEFEHYHRFGPHPCDNCGRQLLIVHGARWGRFLVCSTRCRRACLNRAKREHRADARGSRVCEGCDARFTPARADSLYCSNACRQKAYRERKSS